MTIQPSYPLAWPADRPRTAEHRAALFRDAGRPLTWTTARKRLVQQLDALTRAGKPYRTANVVLSTNIRFTASGSRDQNVSRRDPADPGVALYFDLDRRPHVLACDRWDTVYDNVAAIAAHIEALRGQERWGVADLAQAFAGHVALPAPGSSSPADPWWTVLGIPRATPLEVVSHRYRRLARDAHPDAGGDRAAWDRLTAAYEAAKEELAT